MAHSNLATLEHPIHRGSDIFAWGKALSLLALLSLILFFPLNDDNGAWQSIAIDWVRYGKWPYAGAWDQSFPGILLLHVPAVALFGPSDLGFRSLELLAQIGFCYVFFRLLRLWLREETAWLALLLCVCYFIRSAPFVAGERDLYGAMLVLVAAYPLLRDEVEGITTSIPTVLASGLIAGVAVLIRPTFMVYLLPIVLWMRSIRNVRSILTLITTALIPLALSYVLFALKENALREYWIATVRFNLDVYAQIERPFHTFWLHLTSPGLLALPVAIFIAARLLRLHPEFQRQPSRPILYVYAAFLLLTLALVLWMRKYYLYHLAMFAILLVPLSALGLELIAKRLPPQIRWVSLFVCFGFFALPREMLLQSYRAGDFSNGIGHGVESALDRGLWLDSAYRPTLTYLRQHTNEHTIVEICSFDPRLRAALGLEAATRYSSLHPIGMRTDPRDPTAFTNYQREWRKGYTDSMRSKQPEYIVLQRNSVAEYLKDPYLSVLHGLDGFDSLLTTNYRFDTAYGANQIYRFRH